MPENSDDTFVIRPNLAGLRLNAPKQRAPAGRRSPRRHNRRSISRDEIARLTSAARQREDDATARREADCRAMDALARVRGADLGNEAGPWPQFSGALRLFPAASTDDWDAWTCIVRDDLSNANLLVDPGLPNWSEIGMTAPRRPSTHPPESRGHQQL